MFPCVSHPISMCFPWQIHFREYLSYKYSLPVFAPGSVSSPSALPVWCNVELGNWFQVSFSMDVSQVTFRVPRRSKRPNSQQNQPFGISDLLDSRAKGPWLLKFGWTVTSGHHKSTKSVNGAKLECSAIKFEDFNSWRHLPCVSNTFPDISLVGIASSKVSSWSCLGLGWLVLLTR